MIHTFLLTVKKERSSLSLFKKGQEIGKKEWPEERDMGRHLFEAIEELLRKNNLKPEEVGEFVVESDLSEYSTSRRIAETVQKVYSFAVQFQEKTERT